VWHSPPEPFRFVVEIDRTRESEANLRAKFEEYLAWRIWRYRNGGQPEPDLLVVTTSWTQAEVILRAMQGEAWTFERPYRMWLTTFDLLEEHGLEGAIWRLNVGGDGIRRLPCFREPG
jgi:hypothetical protein